MLANIFGFCYIASRQFRLIERSRNAKANSRERESRAPRLLILGALAAVTASSLQAQTVSTTYDTEASGTQAQENAAYITMLETFNTTGQPATGSAGFAFTDPATNTALYDPYAAARRTVANAQGLDLCTSGIGTGTAVANYATGSTVETSLDDPNATTAHTNAIASAPTSAGVSGGVIGGSLVSIGLPLQPVTGIPAPATPYAPDPGTAAWIAGIEAFAMTTALSFDPADDLERRLLGQPRDSELLAHAIWDESVNTWGVNPDDILLLEAEFGIYGSLPMLVVYFADNYILVDGTNGIVSGPFADTVPYDPIPLLEGHAEYEPGTGARMVIGETGCETDGLGVRWRDKPPPSLRPPSPGSLIPASPNQPTPAPTFPHTCGTPPVPCVPITRRPPGTPSDPKNWWDDPRVWIPAPPPFRTVPPYDYRDDVPGKPTNWDCVPNSDGGETCYTLELHCDAAGNCYYRQVTCKFDNPGHQDQPVRVPGNPSSPYDSWPEPLSPDDDGCEDRWLY